LINVENCVRKEELNLKRYMKESPELLICAAEYVLNDCQVTEADESGEEYNARIMEERAERLMEKEMHGKFFRDISDVAGPQSCDWVSKGFLNKNTEGLIFAAQEQALHTNWLKSKISGGSVDGTCRKCKTDLETVPHLVSACSELAQSEYKKRHDRMGLRVYWELCKKNKIECSSKWFQEIPDPVRTSKCGNYEIWWDRPVETPEKLDHNRPDVILIDKLKKHWIIIDFSVPSDKNVIIKEKEKVSVYTRLAFQVRKMKKVTTQIVPLIVGALGTVSKNLHKNLALLKIPYVSPCMQVSAVIGTATILRKVLSFDQPNI